MPKKIVLIEEDDLVVKLIAKKLSHLDYVVLAAKDGQEGILLLLANLDVSLAVISITAPGKNGLEVLSEIRKNAKLANVPVIFISNSGSSAELEKAQKYGVKDWILKTDFDPSEAAKKIIKLTE